MAETKTNEIKTTEIRIIKKIVEQENGVPFNSYKLVEKNGKLTDLRFKKDVDTRVFDDGTKFTASVEYLQLANNYEYPRYYASGLSNVKKIF